MQYRQLGKTGLMVSEIGLGCEGFVEKDDSFTARLLDIAFENGVNCMDLYVSNPDVRTRLGKALRGRRGKMIMQAHLCTAWKDGQYVRTRDIGEVTEGFEDLTARLETDYIDVGMLHYVDSEEDWRLVAGPIMEYARKLKAGGKIRHIGLSSHNPIAALEAVKSGLIEVLMFSVNPCYDLLPGSDTVEKLWEEESYKVPLLNMDPQRQELYEECQRRGVGITVMKAFGGGDLLNIEDSPAGKTLTVNQCLHYALTRPAVAAVMSGARTIEELEVTLAYETAGEAEKDYADALAAFPKISWRGHCMYCGHCAPCPQRIDVAAVTKFLNLARARDEVPETVREHYAALKHKAGECTACGACERRCPFKVPVRRNMEQAGRIFGA